MPECGLKPKRATSRIRLDVAEKHKGLDELPHITRTDQAGNGVVALAMGFENDGCKCGGNHEMDCAKKGLGVLPSPRELGSIERWLETLMNT